MIVKDWWNYVCTYTWFARWMRYVKTCINIWVP